MATMLAETYSNIRKRLAQILEYEGDSDSSSGYITDLPLDLLNRAQYELWMWRTWEALLKRSTLTLSSRQATLPSDFGGKVKSIFCDTNSDNKPDVYYFSDNLNVNYGYIITGGFAKATGHTWTIKFFGDPPSSPIIEYPRLLDNFTGTGTEYSFFPPDLLLLTAQKIHLEEADKVTDELTAIANKQRQLVVDFEQAWNNQNVDMRMTQLDDDGQTVEISGYDLDGGNSEGIRNVFGNSYDMG